MSETGKKRHGQGDDVAPPDGNPKKAGKKQTKQAEKAIPKWRRIEALKERKALREALSDIWTEDMDLEDDIFDLEDDSEYYVAAPEDDLDVTDLPEEGDEDAIDPEDD